MHHPLTHQSLTRGSTPMAHRKPGRRLVLPIAGLAAGTLLLAACGSGPVGAIADDQNAACVPLLYPSSSVAQFRDISSYPWLVQFLPNADLEAKYDVALIQKKFPSGANVGIAENQTASGKGYSTA